MVAVERAPFGSISNTLDKIKLRGDLSEGGRGDSFVGPDHPVHQHKTVYHRCPYSTVISQ